MRSRCSLRRCFMQLPLELSNACFEFVCALTGLVQRSLCQGSPALGHLLLPPRLYAVLALRRDFAREPLQLVGQGGVLCKKRSAARCRLGWQLAHLQVHLQRRNLVMELLYSSPLGIQRSPPLLRRLSPGSSNR